MQVMAMRNKAVERGEERDEKESDSERGEEERTTRGVPQEPPRLGNRGMERHSNAGKDSKQSALFVCSG